MIIVVFVVAGSSRSFFASEPGFGKFPFFCMPERCLSSTESAGEAETTSGVFGED